MKYLFLAASAVALGLMTGASAQARESRQYYAAVEEACGQDPQAPCISELKRLCGKPASNACIARNKAQLDAATERGFAAVRRRMGGQ